SPANRPAWRALCLRGMLPIGSPSGCRAVPSVGGTIIAAVQHVVGRRGQFIGRKSQFALGGADRMSQRTTAAIWVKGVADMLAAERLDAAALLRAADIDAASLEAPGARVATDKISLLWQLAAERSGNPAIGLAQHDVPRPANFDVVGYTMMSC